MWIFLNNGFFSIVAPTAGDPIMAVVASKRAQRASLAAHCLLVRARKEGDIERVFGPDIVSGEVMECPARDYRFRALVPKVDVKMRMLEAIDDIIYPNFKNSIRDRDYHDACSRVWGVMDDYQRRRPAMRLRGSAPHKPGKG